MSWNMSLRSTLFSVVLALALLAGITAFVALADDDEDGGAAGGGLPEGFSAIPEDVFVERVFGAQRAEQSWHMEQQKSVNGTPGTLIRIDTEEGGERTDASLEISRQDGSTVPLRVIAIDGVYYAKGLNTAKPWWQADPSDGEAQATAVQTFAELLASQTSENLGDAIDEVELVGPDSVDGVTTAHYRLHLTQPVAAPPGSTPVPTPEGQPEATLDVWVDAQDRPIKLVSTAVLEGSEVVYTTTYSSYGAPFGIKAPPANQVTDEVPEG